MATPIVINPVYMPPNFDPAFNYRVGPGSDAYAVGSDGYVYISKITPNIGNDPVTDNGANWVLVEPWSINGGNNPQGGGISLYGGGTYVLGSNGIVYISLVGLVPYGSNPVADSGSIWAPVLSLVYQTGDTRLPLAYVVPPDQKWAGRGTVNPYTGATTGVEKNGSSFNNDFGYDFF